MGATCLLPAGLLLLAAGAMPDRQPKVATSPDEPALEAVLDDRWGLDIDRDLRNPVVPGSLPSGVFHRADRDKPVVFKPLIALGLETTTRGGWYATAPRASGRPTETAARKQEAWTFQYKPPRLKRYNGGPAPPLESGGVRFDPGDVAFGLWISNDEYDEPGVFSQPLLVARATPRLKDQPYRAMIFPNRSTRTGRLIRHSYLVAWEYTGDDDFQDVVTQIDNVKLLPAEPLLPGILPQHAPVKRIATGFQFAEGPAWDRESDALYFCDIPRGHILRLARDDVIVSNSRSGSASGIMFDRLGRLVACEIERRRISRTTPSGITMEVVSRFRDRRLNSPDDLWMDQHGGIYFTDPEHCSSDDVEQDRQAVYYVDDTGSMSRVIDTLQRPNGLAISPDALTLYVVDEAAHTVSRYRIVSPGRVDRGERIAYVRHPNGMTVDLEGRLYVAGEGGIWVLSPKGKWLGIIETLEQPSNCTFGGPNYDTLFITAQTSVYRVGTLTTGRHVHLDGVLLPE